MRILIVPKWYPWPERPVFGIFCQEQARAVSQEHDVVVLASEAVGAPGFAVFSLSEATEEGMRTLRVRYRRPRVRALAIVCQMVGMLAALTRLRRDGWRADVVHAHVYSAALPALVLARLSRAPLVVSEHYTGFQRGLVTGADRLTARVAFRGAAVVAPVSEGLAGYVRELAPHVRIEIVPNIVDTDVFHPIGTPAVSDGTTRLLTVAALAEKKGHRFLLEALHSLPGVTLELIGDGEERAELEARARGLGDRVSFRGEMPKLEVAAAMREADLFVLPSLVENLPCVLIEAQASGLPAVATRVGSVPEIVDNAAGELAEPGDAEALAAAITRALSRRAGFDAPALAERARRRYGYATAAQRWSEIYASSRGSTSRRTSSGRAAAR